MYFTDQNIIQKGDTEKLNFEGLEMQKLNIPTDKTQRADEKWGYLSGYHVSFQSCGH